MTDSVSIRVVHGFDACWQALERNDGLDSLALSATARTRIEQVFGEPLTADDVVERIIDDVRSAGDAAVRRYAAILDGADLATFEISPDRWKAAFDRLTPDLREAMIIAADRIRSFHEKQKRTSWIEFGEDGALGQIVRPLQRIGVYAPGGSAVYPSSLLMTAVPARVAGVEEIIVAAPAGREGVHDLILAAAHVAGVDRVIPVGGAQAIAALAYGTETIPRVDKIFGPGNIFVVLAKRRVFGQVAIDQLPGPTETLVIADSTADPRLTAADMLAQAEHDPMASAILLTTSERLAMQVQTELFSQLGRLPRKEIAGESLRTNGLIGIVPTIRDAVELANHYAPEHLCLLVDDPWSAVPWVTNAGGIFVGEGSPEAIGDYTAGPSHVMPTGGTARFFSPIHLNDFTKVISVAAITGSAINRIGPAAVALARAEGLDAHARAVEYRLESIRPD